MDLADHLLRRDRDALLPPAHLRLFYYESLRTADFRNACENARTELVSRGLEPHHRLLDVGCGIGNLAIPLVGIHKGGYDGIELKPEAISWCRKAITKRDPSFRFHLADIASRAYNPGGTLAADAYRFPFPDGSFDFIFLGSVFTHLLPDAVERYVSEIARLLAAGGICVASYFVLTDDSRRGIDAGTSFIDFPARGDATERCRLHCATIPELAVALDQAFLWRLHERAGLRIQAVRWGEWWKGKAHDQDVLTAVPEPGV